VFNNLVMFDQHAKQSRLDAIVPGLATSWTWNEDGTELSLRLRHGGKWHDGRPFTANDTNRHLLVNRDLSTTRICDVRWR
jgi:peptide/nickel transport system substrate-binding protein